MKTVIDFSCPILPDEQEFPRANDERLQPFYKQLVEDGIMNEKGIILVPKATLRRGIGPRGWLYQLEIP